jgi:hypothetical protein
MSKNTEPNTALPQPTSWQGTFRVFVEAPGSGWKLIGGTRTTIIHRKLLYLPEFSGRTIRAAFANVKFDRRKIVDVNFLWIENWIIGEDGNADKEDQFQLSVRRLLLGAKEDYIENVFAKQQKYIAINVPSNDDIDSIKRCLGLAVE